MYWKIGFFLFSTSKLSLPLQIPIPVKTKNLEHCYCECKVLSFRQIFSQTTYSRHSAFPSLRSGLVPHILPPLASKLQLILPHHLCLLRSSNTCLALQTSILPIVTDTYVSTTAFDHEVYSPVSSTPHHRPIVLSTLLQLLINYHLFLPPPAKE